MKKLFISAGPYLAWIGCIWGSASGFAAGTESARTSLPVLTTIRDVYSLKPQEAARSYPIRLRGTVLYADSRWRILFFQDQTAANFFDLASNQPELHESDLIEIEAVSRLTNGATAFANLKFKVIGQSALPEAVQREIGSLMRGVAINERVAFRGLIERMEERDTRLLLHVQLDAQHSAQVCVRDYRKESLPDLENSVVIITGVNSSQQENDAKSIKLNFFVTSLDDIVVLERHRGDPFQLPVSRLSEIIGRILAEKFDGPDLRRVHVQGRTIEQKVGEWVRIQDDSGSILVRSDLRTLTNPGELIDVVGYPRKTEDGQPVLRSASFQPIVADGTAADKGSGARGLPLLATVREIRNLSPEEARRGYPVLLRCVVTYYDREWRVLFVQDESGGIYVDSSDQEFLIKSGQRVEVSGVTDPGGYAPMITRCRVRVSGPGVLPAPRRIALENLTTGREDSQWVEQDGMIRSVEFKGDHCVLQLKAATGPFQVTIPFAPPASMRNRLIDSKVRVRGTCGVLANVYRQLVGINLHVPDWTQVEFLQPSPEDPFAIPLVEIRDVLRFTPQDVFEHRVRVKGTVTLVSKDGSVYLQDDSGGTRIQMTPSKHIKIGDRVEAIGFPLIGGYAPILEKVQFKKLGSGALPAPVDTLPSRLLSGTNDAQRVRLEARLIESTAGPHAIELALEAAGVVFNAALEQPSPSPDFRPGSVLQLTGTCQVQVDEWRNVRSFRLLLSSLADVQVLRSAPWWSQQRFFVACGALSGTLTLALFWAVSLRRRVQKQTALIRQQLEQEVALEREYRDLFENASDIIYTIDMEGFCTSFNRVAEQTFGLTARQTERTAHAQFYLPESFARLDEALKGMLLRKSLPEMELEAIKPNHPNRTIELRARLIERDGTPIGYQCIARDVTERRQLEAQLQQSRKLESIGQLAAGIAHDFNNVLTIIQGNASLLVSNNLSDPQRVGMASSILDASERAASLTHQLVLFSRKQRLQLRVLNLNEIAGDLIRMLGRLLGEDIELELKRGQNVPPVHGDRSLLEQVILNLAVNARDAMPRGGRLCLAISRTEITDEMLKNNSEARAGTAVLLEVTDSGCGIEPEILPRIFEPFFTTKDVGKGTGLGLATVYGIVKQHSGWITVSSKLGVGTCFRIGLPATSETKPEPSVSLTRSAQHGNERILVVEDESALRELIENVLIRSGYTVFLAANGAAAQEIWKERRGEVDLLLTDIVMPGGMSGIELAEALRQEAPHLKVLYTSGYSAHLSGGNRVRFDNQHNFLPKPYVPQTLLSAVRQSLSQKPERKN